MITITDLEFRWLLSTGLCALVLLVAMFIYTARCARLAYLGEAWQDAAGSYPRAIRALQDFKHETDALVVEHCWRWPKGTVVVMNRLEVERLNATADKGGGPGL